LQTTDAPVKAIAIDAGYRHVRNFTRCFLKQFHLSPINFRRIWRYKDVAA
jgi:transcriptional regulator GlxA family with amidase domain